MPSLLSFVESSTHQPHQQHGLNKTGSHFKYVFYYVCQTLIKQCQNLEFSNNKISIILNNVIFIMTYEHRKQMFKLIDKTIFKIYLQDVGLYGPMHLHRTI